MIPENIETVKIEAVKPEERRGESDGVGPRGPSRLRRRIYLWATLALCTLIIGIFLFKPLYAFYASFSGSQTPPRSGNTVVPAAPGDWPTYLADNGHSSFNASETLITPITAPKLKLKWTHTAGGSIASQPVVVNGVIYWGSWDGFEYATNLNNQVVWKTNLGTTSTPGCSPSPLGISSTATIASMIIKGTMTAVDFVGGGNDNLYALNAHNGAIIWKTALGSSSAYYLWSSPVLSHGSIYIGIASNCDTPLVRGGLVQLDAATGSIQHTFNAVPQGCLGASVWSSPTIDEAAGTIYISTGNGEKCKGSLEPNGNAVIELRASDLSLLHSWQVPLSEQLSDGDFGATPTLFTSSAGVHMVGVENKNGRFYAFKRDDLGKPMWKARIATHRGGTSSSAWDGHRLYVAGRSITLNHVYCQGTITALNPDTGALLWQYCLKGGELPIGAVTAVPGLVVDAVGDRVIVLNAASGRVLFSYQSSDSRFWGWASISHGVLYLGSIDGKLYAFAP